MITESPFKPATFAKNPHSQTILGRFLRPNPGLHATAERLELADGDFVDLFHIDGNGPVVLIVHGLAGSIKSGYARALLGRIKEKNWHGVFIQLRGYGTEPNRLPRFYHGGDTSDVVFALNHLKRRFPHKSVFVVGYSIGANIVLKMLGEYGHTGPVTAAIAVSVPFVLQEAVGRLDVGFSKLYQWSLLRELKHNIFEKFSAGNAPVDIERLKQCRNFYQFDNTVTAPLHGFKNADDYYQRSSCRQFLGAIRTPTLIVHSSDDPFMTAKVIPRNKELSCHVQLELSTSGGHVGFLSGTLGAVDFWLENRIIDFIQQAENTPAPSP